MYSEHETLHFLVQSSCRYSFGSIHEIVKGYMNETILVFVRSCCETNSPKSLSYWEKG